jgi:hypothetical protein
MILLISPSSIVITTTSLPTASCQRFYAPKYVDSQP